MVRGWNPITSTNLTFASGHRIAIQSRMTRILYSIFGARLFTGPVESTCNETNRALRQPCRVLTSASIDGYLKPYHQLELLVEQNSSAIGDRVPMEDVFLRVIFQHLLIDPDANPKIPPKANISSDENENLDLPLARYLSIVAE